MAKELAKAVDPDMMESRRLKIKMKATSAHPGGYKAGEVFEVHPSHEEFLKERKWAVDEDADEEEVKAAGKAGKKTKKEEIPEASK